MNEIKLKSKKEKPKITYICIDPNPPEKTSEMIKSAFRKQLINK